MRLLGEYHKHFMNSQLVVLSKQGPCIGIVRMTGMLLLQSSRAKLKNKVPIFRKAIVLQSKTPVRLNMSSTTQ